MRASCACSGILARSRPTQSSPHVHFELQNECHELSQRIGRLRTARIMQENRHFARHRKVFRAWPAAWDVARVAPNLLERSSRQSARALDSACACCWHDCRSEGARNNTNISKETTAELIRRRVNLCGLTLQRFRGHPIASDAIESAAATRGRSRTVLSPSSPLGATILPSGFVINQCAIGDRHF